MPILSKNYFTKVKERLMITILQRIKLKNNQTNNNYSNNHLAAIKNHSTQKKKDQIL